MVFIEYDLNEFGSNITILQPSFNPDLTQDPVVISISRDQFVAFRIPNEYGISVIIEQHLTPKEIVVLLVNNDYALIGRVSVYNARDPSYWGKQLNGALTEQLHWRDKLADSKLFVWEPKEEIPEEFTTSFLKSWTSNWNLHATREVYEVMAKETITAMEFNKHKITRTLDSWTKCGVESKTLYRSDYLSKL
ncbi:hypothetical protein TSTA_111050 [Talaromyces stipitatus ATCC 10500]|uniref:Uncharacterized protein n=1 Tax=Talaromyces stipitatus (strain ATCC 10500 / CBS 375.48 / QM 6759 / NRRL 1006) TaxID=441959 RepID=B8MU72_TALSN|nr:uncharacterized protein TSTA_111050 [Talaromyces stipitatus ATCC 10500]XP_002488851.1 uncharacterized protein TSTA_080520 [Talaromyces stipitatus ATCC 10500]EED11441.1 hypothetical protein TSTA_080520 [Talaromyces stipitatus ATCC 10500]EED11928.1 hypothetical protein TSTA_111050 [Talaromyces stipitatus ATCC 10500]